MERRKPPVGERGGTGLLEREEERGVAPRLPAEISPAEILRAARETFYRDPRVLGVGLGEKRRDHRIKEGVFALLVYVEKKLPEGAIQPDLVVPKEFMGLPTDVIEPFSHETATTSVDYVHDHHMIHDMTNLDWGRVHHLVTEGEVQPIVPHAVQIQDFGDICVIEDDGTLVKTINGQQQVDFVRAYQLFRTKHGDDYDHVTFFLDTVSGMPQECACSFFSWIYNDVQGIGLPSINSRVAWGTARLQGFHFMNQGHFPIWRYVMGQEWLHQFAAFARYRDPVTGATMNDHLLGGWGHWALNLDDDRSPMDYDTNDWVEQAGGQFRKVAIGSDRRIYCNLDLYLMGLLGPNEVGEFYLLRNTVPVPGSGTDFTANPVRLNPQNFINQEGVRVPTVATSQKYWRQAFIVLTKDIHKAHDLVETVDLLRLRWEQDFYELTKGLGRIDTVLDSRPGRITPSQIGELLSGAYTNLHRHQVLPNDLRVVRTQFVGAVARGQTRSWFTYNWPTSWFVTWSLRPTTNGGKIRWDVAIERAANNTFTYWLTVTNVGPIDTNFEGKYAILM